jgi:hypothetical protein
LIRCPSAILEKRKKVELPAKKKLTKRKLTLHYNRRAGSQTNVYKLRRKYNTVKSFNKNIRRKENMCQ